jgi:hypothetical protein
LGAFAITARLKLSDTAVSRLEGAGSRQEKRTALQAVHDELAATLVPALRQLQTDGVLIDFATSWMLAEVVAHAPEGQSERALEALRQLPELTGVAPAGREKLRRL